jgi:hypothetical protein
MKYPPEKLINFTDKQLAVLANNANDLGASEQFDACNIEIERRKKSKKNSRSILKSREPSQRDMAEEVLVIAQKAALAKYPSHQSFNNPWGDSKDGLVEGRPKISGSARHLASLGPKSIAGETRMAYASHVSLSYGLSKSQRALVFIEACEEKPDSEISFIVGMRCWNVEWPEHIPRVRTASGFWELLNDNKLTAIGEYSMTTSDEAISDYLRAVDWMSTLV